MINLKEVSFGWADANTEAEREPKVFQKVFFDPHEYMDDLIHGDRFILRGRKGDGKTAYSAQIVLNSSQNRIYAYSRSLANFDNSTFGQIKTYDLEGNRYISLWKCILLIECVGMLMKFEPHIQNEEYGDIYDSLTRRGFLSSDNDISITVNRLVESNATLTLNPVAYSRRYERGEELRGAEQIYSAIRNAIRNIYLPKKFLLIIDGLDDILRYDQFDPTIITGLIRAVQVINRDFKRTTLSIKTVLLIRDDILNMCRDSNLTNIIRDSAIKLSWNFSGDPYESDLIHMVSKRVDLISKEENSFGKVWKEICPNLSETKDSLDYVLENIIYRPRDILQFFIELQKEFVPGKMLTVEKVQNALRNFSTDYFLDSMLDELTGFFPNKAITDLPYILSKMGDRYFYLNQFEEECAQNSSFKDVQARQMLEKLFDAGYIGQHRPRENGEYTVFSYRNVKEKFHAEHECILHRGLMRALTF